MKERNLIFSSNKYEPPFEFRANLGYTKMTPPSILSVMNTTTFGHIFRCNRSDKDDDIFYSPQSMHTIQKVSDAYFMAVCPLNYYIARPLRREGKPYARFSLMCKNHD